MNSGMCVLNFKSLFRWGYNKDIEKNQQKIDKLHKGN